jgi:hypothetical protein
MYTPINYQVVKNSWGSVRFIVVTYEHDDGHELDFNLNFKCLSTCYFFKSWSNIGIEDKVA